MKAVVLFHSVTGSCYEMAQLIHKEFNNTGINTDILRIKDDKQQEWTKQFEQAKKCYDKITNVPEVRISELPLYDLIILCSPTYFGNVSAEVKAFMDDMACYWMNRKMSGKIILACASAATATGGGSITLQAINTFGQHMGMLPYAINTLSMPAYGLLHIAGPTSQKRVEHNNELKDAVKSVALELAKS